MLRAILIGLVLLAGCVEEGGLPAEFESGPGTAPEAIQAWLVAGGYEGWPKESGAIPSSAFGAARTFFSPALARSVSEGAERHPVGAVAVREYYGPDFETLRGYAYLLRVDEGQGPESWFWLESWSLEAEGEPQVAGFGVSTCAGCHTEGRDFIQTGWPLR